MHKEIKVIGWWRIEKKIMNGIWRRNF